MKSRVYSLNTFTLNTREARPGDASRHTPCRGCPAPPLARPGWRRMWPSLGVEELPRRDLGHQVVVGEALPRHLPQPHPSCPVVCHCFGIPSYVDSPSIYSCFTGGKTTPRRETSAGKGGGNSGGKRLTSLASGPRSSDWSCRHSQ
jgi:hypothetical protein